MTKSAPQTNAVFVTQWFSPKNPPHPVLVDGELECVPVIVTHTYGRRGLTKKRGRFVEVAYFTLHTKEWRFPGCNWDGTKYIKAWTHFPAPFKSKVTQ